MQKCLKPKAELSINVGLSYLNMEGQMKLKLMLIVTALLVSASGVYAELHDRGNGLIYDDVLGITWLQDANLAASNRFGVSEIQSNGSMNWNTAHNWIAALNADGENGYLGFNNWRLPTNTPVNGINYNYTFSTDGSTDFGYNNSAPNSAFPENKSSEMSYMYYNNLGGIGYFDVNGDETGCGFDGPPCRPNDGPFANLVPNYYWTGVDRGEGILGPIAATFRQNIGSQDVVYQSDEWFVWAVRDGDVLPIPEPTIDAILDFFDESVEAGTLEGHGRGNSANNRLNNLRKKLLKASDLIEFGDIDGGCAHLSVALKKCDGIAPPPDFVSGEAVEELNNMISELMVELGCD